MFTKWLIAPIRLHASFFHIQEKKGQCFSSKTGKNPKLQCDWIIPAAIITVARRIQLLRLADSHVPLNDGYSS